MRIARTLCFLFLIFTLISCSDDDKTTAPETKTDVILPLSVGNSWTYSRIEQIDSDSYSSTVELAVSKDTTIGGVKYFLFGEKDGKAGQECTWTVNKTDGFYGMYKDTTVMMIKFPVKAGDEFKYGGYDGSYKVASIDTVITTKAGTFKCIKYIRESKTSSKGDPDYRYSYEELCFCPNVGMIKSTYLSEGSDFVNTSVDELQSYNLK